MCVILQVVLLLVCRAHKPNFFCSSGDQIVTTVTVSEWYCEKSTFSACGDLALKEISVAIYLFSKGSLMVPLPSPPPPKKKRKHMESVNFLLQNFICVILGRCTNAGKCEVFRGTRCMSSVIYCTYKCCLSAKLVLQGTFLYLHCKYCLKWGSLFFYLFGWMCCATCCLEAAHSHFEIPPQLK